MIFMSVSQRHTPSSMSGEYIYSGGFWDSKTCAVCARWDRSGAAAPNSAPKIVWQFLEPSLVLLQQSTDQSEKSCEDNLPVSSNISKPNSAPKRCDRIGSASVATWALAVSSFVWILLLGILGSQNTKIPAPACCCCCYDDRFVNTVLWCRVTGGSSQPDTGETNNFLSKVDTCTF